MPSADKQDEDFDLQSIDSNNVNGKKKIKIKKRRYYPTTQGKYCVNAVNGMRYPWKSGSYNELQLFKMIDATGKYDKDGFLIKRSEEKNKDPNFLYFDSPEQYAKHMRIKLDHVQSQKWHSKVRMIFPNGSFDLDAYTQYKNSGIKYSNYTLNEEEYYSHLDPDDYDNSSV